MQDHNSARDHELDSLLATYAAVEPRPGLEQRVLANLRVNQQLGRTRNAWRSPVLALLAAAVVIAVAWSSLLIKRQAPNSAAGSGPAAPRYVANSSQPPGSAQGDEERRVPEGAPSARRRKAAAKQLHRDDGQPAKTSNEVAPKLERFPAPEPLSEQEKLLVRFVQFDPQAAALVAEERAEQLQHEEEEVKNRDGKAPQVEQGR